MNKVAIITGASSGIGRAITQAMLDRGDCIVANGRTCLDVYQETDRIAVSTADLLDETTPQKLLDLALSRFGQVDYLFVNAGTIASASIQEMDIEKMCRMMRLKVESAFRLIYTVLKVFVERGSGHILITSSVLGTKTREYSGAYAACNYALEALAESLRMELSDTDIEITCIEPGLVQTNLHRDWPVHPRELLGISHALAPADIAEAVIEIIDKPDHVRIPRYMILPKGHRV